MENIENAEGNQFPTKYKIIISILIVIIILLIITFIIFAVLKGKEKKAKLNEEIKEEYEYDSIKYTNLLYSKDKIKNSFKRGGSNFNEEIGEMNEGQDYIINDRNIYDLYIPYINSESKKKHNQIFLYIHGGSWIEGNKEDLTPLCEFSLSQGYITATIGYTLLIEQYKNYNPNIFRILDEVTESIESIKKILYKEGFNTEKLELVMSGASAGAHIALLYSYLMKNSPLPIKFIINYVGPIGIGPKYFIRLKNTEETLENIEVDDIENAKNEDKITDLYPDKKLFLLIMNSFIGNRSSENELDEMMVNDEINVNNEKYKKLYSIAKYGFPVNLINEDSIPVLCVYGGKDEFVGIGQYSYLKSAYEKYHNTKIELIYIRDANHNVFVSDSSGTINFQLLGKLITTINKFLELYCISD